MTLLTTTTYGITYADPDEPLGNYPDITKRVADTVDAALIRGGIAPPNTADLAALTGRVNTIDTRVTAREQLARVTVTATPTPASGTTPVLVSWTAKTTRSIPASFWVATAPTLLTAPVAGEYDLDVSATWAGNVTGLRGIAYRVNGGTWTYLDLRVAPNSTAVPNAHSARLAGLELTAGQTVEIGLTQNSGAALATPVRATLALAKP